MKDINERKVRTVSIRTQGHIRLPKGNEQSDRSAIKVGESRAMQKQSRS